MNLTAEDIARFETGDSPGEQEDGGIPDSKVHPSMFQSKRYRRFKEQCRRVRENVPDELKTFGTQDVPDQELRHWLRQYARRWEEGRITRWQEQFFKSIGFTGVFRTRPGYTGEKRDATTTREDFRKRCEEIRANLPEGQETFAIYDVKDPKTSRWLSRYRRLRNSGKLASWKVEALTEFGFNWKGGPRPYDPNAPRPPKNIDECDESSHVYRQFKERCEAIRASVPDELETFSIGDVSSHELRQSLLRYLKRQEKGTLGKWRKELLEGIGFNWTLGNIPENPKAKLSGADLARWETNFARLQAILKTAEDPMIALVRLDDELFDWFTRELARLRADRMDDETRARMRSLMPELPDAEEIKELNAWRRLLPIYREIYGDDAASIIRVTEDSVRRRRADQWADRQRESKKEGNLAAWKIRLLDEIGFDWEQSSVVQRMHERWYANLDRLLALQAKHGKPLPVKMAISSGLQTWMSRMRSYHAKGTLPPKVLKVFEEKGFEFDGVGARKKRLEQHWQRYFRKLLAYRERFGNAQVPVSFYEDRKLGMWLSQQRERMKAGTIDPDKRRALEELGIKPRYSGRRGHKRPIATSPWLRNFRQLEKIAASRPDGKIPDEIELEHRYRYWLRRQYKAFAKGILEKWQVEGLRGIGFDPAEVPEVPAIKRINQHRWETNLKHIREFVAEHGHISVPKKPENQPLLSFLARVRAMNRRGELTEQQQKELADAGMVMDPTMIPSYSWYVQYKNLCAYHAERGTCTVPRREPPFIQLYDFVAQQKQRGRTGKLTPEHIRLLDLLDFPWYGGRPTPRGSLAKQGE